MRDSFLLKVLAASAVFIAPVVVRAQEVTISDQPGKGVVAQPLSGENTAIIWQGDSENVRLRLFDKNRQWVGSEIVIPGASTALDGDNLHELALDMGDETLLLPYIEPGVLAIGESGFANHGYFVNVYSHDGALLSSAQPIAQGQVSEDSATVSPTKNVDLERVDNDTFMIGWEQALLDINGSSFTYQGRAAKVAFYTLNPNHTMTQDGVAVKLSADPTPEDTVLNIVDLADPNKAVVFSRGTPNNVRFAIVNAETHAIVSENTLPIGSGSGDEIAISNPDATGKIHFLRKMGSAFTYQSMNSDGTLNATKTVSGLSTTGVESYRLSLQDSSLIVTLGILDSGVTQATLDLTGNFVSTETIIEADAVERLSPTTAWIPGTARATERFTVFGSFAGVYVIGGSIMAPSGLADWNVLER